MFQRAAGITGDVCCSDVSVSEDVAPSQHSSRFRHVLSCLSMNDTVYRDKRGGVILKLLNENHD